MYKYSRISCFGKSNWSDILVRSILYIFLKSDFSILKLSTVHLYWSAKLTVCVLMVHIRFRATSRTRVSSAIILNLIILNSINISYCQLRLEFQNSIIPKKKIVCEKSENLGLFAIFKIQPKYFSRATRLRRVIPECSRYSCVTQRYT